MTIEEIKEWRKSGLGMCSGYLPIIDTLLAEVERLNDCKGCDLPRRINIATEALERIVSEGDYTAPEGMKYIARTALEGIKG